MKLRGRHNDLVIFVRFILPYLLVIAIPLSVSYTLSRYMIGTYKDEALESYSIVLHNNMATTANQLRQVEDMVDSIALNPRLREFFDVDRLGFYDLYDIRNILVSYNVDDEIVESIYLYSNKLDYVVDRDRAYLSLVSFFDAMGMPQDFYKNWDARMKDTSWARRYIPADEEFSGQNYLLYTQSVPLSYTKTAKGKIEVMLNKQAIMGRYADIMTEAGGVCIFDAKNQLLASNNGAYDQFIQENLSSFEGEFENQEWKVEKERVFISSLISEENGWKYIFMIPRKQLLLRVETTNLVLMLIYAVTLLAGIFVSFIITSKKAREFNEVMGIIDGYGVKIQKRMGLNNFRESEYSFIKHGVDKLVSDNRQYKSQLELQQEQMNDTILDKLIAGRYQIREALEDDLRQTNLSFEADRYVLLLVGLGREYRLEIAGRNGKEFVHESLYNIIDGYIYLHDVSSRNIAVIFPFNKDEGNIRQQVRNAVSIIKVEISYPYDIQMQFGAGVECSELLELSTAFKQAREVLNYNEMGYEKEVLWYDEMPNDKNTYQYPLAVENRLYNYALVGNKHEVQATLDSVYHDNFVSRTLSSETVERLLNEIRSTIRKIWQDAGESTNEISFVEDRSVAEQFGDFNEVLQRLCDKIQNANASKTQKAIDKIIAYVNSKYTDSNLSLSDLSVKFKLNEKYVSSIFKEYTGENFSSYVERKRIEEACCLIAEGDLPITAIAQKVGYANDVTFRRAFKRNKNVSPSGYAENLKQ